MIKYNSHKTIINLQLIPLLPLTYTYINLYNPYHTPTAISTPPTNITNLNSLYILLIIPNTHIMLLLI